MVFMVDFHHHYNAASQNKEQKMEVMDDHLDDPTVMRAVVDLSGEPNHPSSLRSGEQASDLNSVASAAMIPDQRLQNATERLYARGTISSQAKARRPAPSRRRRTQDDDSMSFSVPRRSTAYHKSCAEPQNSYLLEYERKRLLREAQGLLDTGRSVHQFSVKTTLPAPSDDVEGQLLEEYDTLTQSANIYKQTSRARPRSAGRTSRPTWDNNINVQRPRAVDMVPLSRPMPRRPRSAGPGSRRSTRQDGTVSTVLRALADTPRMVDTMSIRAQKDIRRRSLTATAVFPADGDRHEMISPPTEMRLRHEEYQRRAVLEETEQRFRNEAIRELQSLAGRYRDMYAVQSLAPRRGRAYPTHREAGRGEYARRRPARPSSAGPARRRRDEEAMIPPEWGEDDEAPRRAPPGPASDDDDEGEGEGGPPFTLADTRVGGDMMAPRPQSQGDDEEEEDFTGTVHTDAGSVRIHDDLDGDTEEEHVHIDGDSDVDDTKPEEDAEVDLEATGLTLRVLAINIIKVIVAVLLSTVGAAVVLVLATIASIIAQVLIASVIAGIAVAIWAYLTLL